MTTARQIEKTVADVNERLADYTEEGAQAAYNAELMRRYLEGLPLTKADRPAARRLIKAA